MPTPTFLAETYREQVHTIVEVTFDFLLDNGDEDWINQIYSMVEIPDWEYIHSIMERVSPIAHIVAPDGELPATRVQIDFTNFVQRHSKLGLQHIWDESRLMAMGRALQYASTESAMDNAITQFYLTPHEELIMKLMDTARYLTLQQIFTLIVNYQDPLTDARVDLDFRSLAPDTLWPAALTGGDRWDQYGTATGLQDLDEHLEAYYRVNRRYPEEIRMHYSLIQHLLNQDSTAAFIQNALDVSIINLGNSNREIQRLALLNNILSQSPLRNGQNYPLIASYERVFPVQINPTTIEYREGVPLDRYCFIDRRNRNVLTSAGMEQRNVMGIGLWGPTIESSLVGMGDNDLDPTQVLNNVDTGPYVWTKKLGDSGFATKGVGNYVPFPFDVKQYGGRKVIDLPAA